MVVQFTPSLHRFLAENGFDATMGARPMQRLIQDRIRKVLADELLFGRLSEGGEVTIDYDPACDKVNLVFSGLSASNQESQTELIAG